MKHERRLRAAARRALLLLPKDLEFVCWLCVRYNDDIGGSVIRESFDKEAILNFWRCFGVVKSSERHVGRYAGK